MSGHLRTTEFMQLIDGETVREGVLHHLDGCTECRDTLHTARLVHQDVASLEDSCIPEPDWDEFRSKVRDRLIARNVQKPSVIQKLLAPFARPVMAWGLSLALAVSLGTGLWAWNRSVAERSGSTVGSEVSISDDELAWSSAGVFEELSDLSPAEAERLRELLTSEQR